MTGSVHIYQQWCPKAQRDQDKSLMLAFQHKYGKQKKKLAQLNRCRIWLQMTTLSDVTDANGTTLCPYASKGEKHPHREHTIHMAKTKHYEQKSLENMVLRPQDNFHDRRSTSPLAPRRLERGKPAVSKVADIQETR